MDNANVCWTNIYKLKAKFVSILPISLKREFWNQHADFSFSKRVDAFVSYLVSFPCFIESGFNKPNADGTDTHANKGGNSHDLRPPRHNALRGQIIFVAFVFALGLASLFYTIWLGNRGRAEPFYSVFGVLAVYLSAVYCFVL